MTHNSHKRQFKAWQLKQEAEGRVFFDNLSEVDATAQGDDDIQVGDFVMFVNDYGVEFGPHEVMGFSHNDYERYIYLDYDCYWFPTRRTNVKKLTLQEVASISK